MTKRILKSSVAAVAALALITAVVIPTAVAQAKPEDMKKVMAEIAGDWNFTMGDQTLTVQFTVQDGKLFGAPPDETPEELKPVQDKPLCFDVTVSGNGEYYFMKFIRSEKGVIDKCTMTVQGMEVPGVKIIK